MSHPGDERYSSYNYSRRRSPPAGEVPSAGLFQTGQGGRPVLPPLSAAFPTSRSPVPAGYSNQYSQPRPVQGRSDHSPALYTQWPNSTAQQQPTFPMYEHHDPRYLTQQQSFPSYQSRTTPTLPGDTSGSRRLPPLNVSPHGPRDERWQSTQYSTHVPTTGGIRSPTASYPAAYASYPTHQQTSYSYPPVPDPRNPSHPVTLHGQHQQMHSGQVHIPAAASSRFDPHAASYGRNAQMMAPPYVQTEVPQSIEEPTIKKKRKRADAHQLKILNETYNRTAFPSTEERAELAKQLDMSARSVQIWFQNKRQSMRQTSRQSTSVNVGTHQPFSMSTEPEPVLEELARSSTYSSRPTSVGPSSVSASYQPRSTMDASRSVLGHSSHSPPHSSTLRRPRSPEDAKYVTRY